ncbi:hypothetical protein [Saccharothrix australiensis]|uniref:Uncharacterized protein n=1 Tax=Saccharothrix australiensis TaxID=2072 RepID=A0A495W107_9PSEU|nr:hypothetical protein [Saccharothrix australiensis]RKT54385.1 hypothetical protein C8E97_3005 [Saccharothrix australiensis]
MDGQRTAPPTPWDIGPDPVPVRLRRSADALAALRSRIGRWFAERRADRAFRRFTGHFDVLETVLLRMLDRLAEASATPVADPGECYERCRRLDGRVSLVRGLFEWYAEKYDQRLDGRPHAGLLRAADEVTRSCWQEPFVAADLAPPTGPLCFVDGASAGHSVRRCPVPSDFRVAGDDPLAAFVAELPVPLVALPENATREAWWLVVTAHETGHHVQHDLGLTVPVVEALASAAPPGLGREWSTWSGEVFADAFSVLMVGEAAGWAVGELAFGSTGHLLRPVGAYPAPVVRLALLGEVLRGARALDAGPQVWPSFGTGAAGGTGVGSAFGTGAVGGAGGGAVSGAAEADGAGGGSLFGAAEAERWLVGLAGSGGPARERALAHARALPGIASALLDLPVAGYPLRSLADRDVLSNPRRIERWAAQLGRANPVLTPIDTRSAPRVLLAAGVRRYRSAGAADDLAGLHRALVRALAGSGAPGVLARRPDRSATGLADRLADRLLAEDGVR